MNKDVYMHSINHNYFNSKRDIQKLSYILRRGYLLSLARQGKQISSGFAGLDYISLCDYSKRNITNNGLSYYNAYYQYIRHGISLCFDKNIIDQKYNVIVPNLIDAPKKNKIYYCMNVLGNEEERYSDLPDEVQIKDFISLRDLSYITYPCEEFFYSKLFIRQESKRKKLKEELNNLREILLSHDLNLRIYDIDSETLLDEEGIEKVLSLRK